MAKELSTKELSTKSLSTICKDNCIKNGGEEDRSRKPDAWFYRGYYIPGLGEADQDFGGRLHFLRGTTA
ncbi:hypothetical protein CEXT_493761 [Caerostris extrusa]|uniref:Uncharacterized protein n=1 Tax=Caerostris extrusa TaxID=172846 RepID=A0AAV4T593_CAEEX|nr:hypothetical protein CEXT_493761 [Caerostris extrusa]